MIGRLWLLACGQVRVRVTGASLTRFLNLCAAQGITLRQMDRTGFPDVQAAHGKHGLPRAYSPETRSAVPCGASVSAYGALGRSRIRRGVVLAARHACMGDTDRDRTGDR